ncbi:MAG: translation initiation factor IF-2, partial [Planctomycetaceae bacterium]
TPPEQAVDAGPGGDVIEPPAVITPAPVEEAPVAVPVEPPPTRAEVETEAAPDAASAPAGTAPPAGESPVTPGAKPPLAPMRREDYVHASGSGRREMVAIGSVSRLAPESKKAKSRPMPTLPKLAEPPPTAKPAAQSTPVATGPAQKPEMRISRDMLEKTPLQEHIKAHNQEKKRRPGEEPGEEFSEEAKRVPGRGPVRPMISAGGLVADRKTGRPARRGRSREEDEDLASMRLRRSRGGRRGSQTQMKSSAQIEFPITVRGLSEAMGRRANELIGMLMKKGQMLTINSYLEEDQALELALECGVDLQIEREKDVEEQLEESLLGDEGSEHRQPRPPIVTILGHVDHGKTTLLDRIRSANVAAGEFGGITQHIAAYQVPVGDKRVTFLDTPGHAAFAEMRARGANVTDIAVLVVAANDGVMPQTIEALNHARAANVPIVVAMNKVDLPDRNEQRVLQELATHNLLAAEWGGDTEVVRTSGATGQGVDDLLETLLTVAELGELTGNPDKGGHGVCLEAFRDEGRGVLVWMIVQDGSLKKGDVVLCGSAHGRIRAMYDDHDREVEVAGPSTPVKVAGLDRVPAAGDKFYTLDDIDEAREIAEVRQQRGREAQLAQRGRVRTLQEILSQAETGEVQELPVIIKADTPGSLEAIKSEILKFQHAEVRVQILHDGVGGVNESDVYLASASGAIVLAFHVVPEDRAESLAEREGVEIRQYQIIYEVTDDIRKALEGLLKPEVVQTRTGRAIVLQTFDISRFGRVAGCRVLNGLIERSNLVRVVRDQRILNEYKIASLKRGKDDSREVREGLECGIRLEGFDDVKEGDILEAIKVEEVKRTL